MAFLEFENLIDKFIEKNIIGYVEKIIGETSKTQYFAIVVNRVVVFKIRLILNIDYRFGKVLFLEELSDHLTSYNYKQKCNEISSGLKNDPIIYPRSNLSVYNPCDPDLKKFFYIEKSFKLTEIENPIKFFQSGDYIKINIDKLYFKNAIYTDNLKVIHVSFSSGQVEECDLSELVEDNEFFLTSYLFSTRRKNEINEHAQRLLGTRKTDNTEINFARFCSTGLERRQNLTLMPQRHNCYIYENDRWNELTIKF